MGTWVHLADNKVMNRVHCAVHPHAWLMDHSGAASRYDNSRLAPAEADIWDELG